MIDTYFKIYYSEVTKDEDGNPTEILTYIDVLGHIEKKNTTNKLQDEGEFNKSTFWVRITDSESITRIKQSTHFAIFIEINSQKYTIKEINNYYSHIEIITT